MNTLTKVFVVFTLLLSIAYCVAAAFLFTYSKDYKDLYEREQQAHENTRQTMQDEIDKLSSDLKSANGRIFSLEEANNKLTRDITELTNKYNEKCQEYDNLDLQFKKLNTAHTTLVRTCEDLRQNLKEERDKNEKLRAQLAVMENKNDNLTKELAILSDDNRKLDKKLIALRKELHASEEVRLKQEAILTKLKEMDIKVEDILVRAEPVHGQVLAVDPETDIVVVSVGENAHVTKGMNLSIYRDDKYVGRIIVISVFPDMSSGRIIRSHTQREVKPGDNVTNRF